MFYLLGGMGGGDVKLMAGFGALLGPEAACSGLVDRGRGRNAGGGAIAGQPRGYAAKVIAVASGRRRRHGTSEARAGRNRFLMHRRSRLGVWLALVPKG